MSTTDAKTDHKKDSKPTKLDSLTILANSSSTPQTKNTTSPKPKPASSTILPRYILF